MRLVATLSEQLEAALRKDDHLARVLLFVIGISLDLAFGYASNVLNYILSLPDKADQSLVFRFEQLEKGPDCDVLEGGIAGLQETAQIAVDAFVRLVPVLDKY